MKMKRPSRATLVRYFKGKSLLHEKELVELFLAMEKDPSFVESCLKEAWEDISSGPGIVTEAERKVFLQKFHLQKQRLKQFPPLWTKRLVALTSAAIVLFGLFTSYWFFQVKPLHDVSATYTAETTGQPLKICLEDSSTVFLFPGSKLMVLNRYNCRYRKVRLTGRAYFEIAPNREVPFLVTAGSLTTRGLGTSFEVNPDETDSTYVVSLRTGKVAVLNGRKELARLNVNQQFVYNSRKRTQNIRNIPSSETTGWIRGELDYELIPLQVICRDLEKWFGVSIRIENEALKSKKITTSFSNEPIDQVLEILSESTGSHFSINEKQIILK